MVKQQSIVIGGQAEQRLVMLILVMSRGVYSRGDTTGTILSSVTLTTVYVALGMWHVFCARLFRAVSPSLLNHRHTHSLSCDRVVHEDQMA